jgi:hypothetical protein
MRIPISCAQKAITEAVSDGGFVACGSTICPPPAGYDYMRTFQNAASRQGHPKGTLQLQYTNLLDATKGYSYKPKDVLANYLAGGADAFPQLLGPGDHLILPHGAVELDINADAWRVLEVAL